MRSLAPPFVFFVGAAVLAGCSGTTGEEWRLVVGRPADALRLDPASVTDTESGEVCEQIFEHLTRYNKAKAEIEPALAENWEFSAGGTDWIFHLRRGVRFHDGTPMNADAVVFSLERQRDPQHPYHRSEYNYFESNFAMITRVETIDEYTVRIVIERPYAPFLANLATSAFSIVSPAAVKRWGAEWDRHPVGTGPFRFVEWSGARQITLAANPDYWDGPTKLTRLVFAAIPDDRQRLVALEGGAIDVAESLAPQDIQFVRLHPELQVVREGANTVSYLAMNVTHRPLDDVNIRRAINHAINRSAIVKLIYQDLATPASGPLPPKMLGYVDDKPYEYDVAKAKRMLEEAHFDPARRLSLYVMSTPRPYMPAPEQVARIVASNLAEVGIDVDLYVNPLAEHQKATMNGKHDLCLSGWSGDNGDPDNFLYLLFDGDNAQLGSATNIAFFSDPQLQGTLSWAQQSQDRKERERYYINALRIIHDDAPWVPLAHSQVVVAERKRVIGLDVQPSAVLYFHGVRLGRR